MSAFGVSSHLSRLFADAPYAKLVEEVTRLLNFVDSQDANLIATLCASRINNKSLYEIAASNDRIANCTDRNHMRNSAVNFWVAQTLATTVLRPSALDQSAQYPSAVTTLMERGADGLYHIGEGQFFSLQRVVENLSKWLVDKQAKSVALVESPLGNTLPVQVMCDYGKQIGLKVDPILWGVPRNDQAGRGATIKSRVNALVAATASYDYVVLVDDVITGTRLRKVFDALIKPVGRRRLLAIALVIADTMRPPQPDDVRNRERLLKRLREQGASIGFDEFWVDVAPQRFFRIDDGKPVRWESPLIWGDSDLIAGKRKVNLVFTLIDHFFVLLEDLGSPRSIYRPYLEAAWKQDTSGQEFRWSDGLLESTFRTLVDRLSSSKLKSKISFKARAESDHSGS